MKPSDNELISMNQLEALFKQREAAFQEEIYKSYAMAATSETYYAVQKIAIALIRQCSYFEDEISPAAIVDEAITIHEQIENYSRQQNEEQPNAEQLPQQND